MSEGLGSVFESIASESMATYNLALDMVVRFPAFHELNEEQTLYFMALSYFHDEMCYTYRKVPVYLLSKLSHICQHILISFNDELVSVVSGQPLDESKNISAIFYFFDKLRKMGDHVDEADIQLLYNIFVLHVDWHCVPGVRSEDVERIYAELKMTTRYATLRENVEIRLPRKSSTSQTKRDKWADSVNVWQNRHSQFKSAPILDELSLYEREQLQSLFRERLVQEGVQLPSNKYELEELEQSNYTAYICLSAYYVIWLRGRIQDTLLMPSATVSNEFKVGWNAVYHALSVLLAKVYVEMRDNGEVIREGDINTPKVGILAACKFLPLVLSDVVDTKDKEKSTSYTVINVLTEEVFRVKMSKITGSNFYECYWTGLSFMLQSEPLVLTKEATVKKYVSSEPVQIHEAAPKTVKKVVATVVQEPIDFESAPDKIPNVRVVQETAKWIETQQPFKDYLAKYPNFAQILNIRGICKEIARCNGGKIPAYEDIKKLFGSHVFTLYMCVPVLYYVAKYDGLFKANFRGNEDLTSKYQTFYGTMVTDIIKVMQYSKLRECNSKRPDFLRRTENRLMAFPDQCMELENLIFRMRDAEDTQITFESVGDYISSLSELYS